MSDMSTDASIAEVRSRLAGNPVRLTDAELDAIEERANAATPGAWIDGVLADGEDVAQWVLNTMHGGEHFFVLWVEGETLLIPALTGDGPTSEANAAFIAHARTDVPRLLTEVRRLRAALDGDS